MPGFSREYLLDCWFNALVRYVTGEGMWSDVEYFEGALAAYSR